MASVRFALSVALVQFAVGLAQGSAATNLPSAPGSNPIFRDVFTADPAPLVVGDTLYCYVGHDEAKQNEMFSMWEWLCYSTKDMKHWVSHGAIMQVTNFTWAVRDAWAAQVVHHKGKFYLFATAQHGPPYPGKAVGVAVSDRPTGPFVDARGSALIRDNTTPSPYPWDDIDPTVFIDDDGTAWMAWGNPNCYLVKLKPDLLEIDGPIHRVPLPNYTEGPWLHKRDGIYYLTYAAFAHQGMWERICYATATNILGPWTYRGILTGQAKNSYTIHPGIIEFRGQWYFFYHNATLTLGGLGGALGRRSVCVEYLYYDPDGLIYPIEQTVEGVSKPPSPPTRPPDRARNLGVASAGVRVIQTNALPPVEWPGTPVVCTVANPYYDTPECISFNFRGATNLGQTFVVPHDVRLERVCLYAGDGFGTDENKPVILALYEVDTSGTAFPNLYSPLTNLFGMGNGLNVIYDVQPPTLLTFEFTAENQVVLKAGKLYVFELQGVRGSAPLFWRKSKKDVYRGGAAYANRLRILDKANSTCDFSMAIYGRPIDAKDETGSAVSQPDE